VSDNVPTALVWQCQTFFEFLKVLWFLSFFLFQVLEDFAPDVVVVGFSNVNFIDKLYSTHLFVYRRSVNCMLNYAIPKKSSGTIRHIRTEPVRADIATF
jgi:hypothetical protein